MRMARTFRAANAGRRRGCSPRRPIATHFKAAAARRSTSAMASAHETASISLGWKALDKSFWSHLARGSVESGYAVAMPSYTLCPAVRISEITREIASAVERAAAMVEGPLFLTGHSAGGHLVTRMISATSPLGDDVRARIRHTVSISGVHDL